MFSKTLILSSQNKFMTNSPRAILTLINEKNGVLGKIRLYNLDRLNRDVKIGIYYDEKVLTSNIISVDDHYEFLLDKPININNDIYCALVDTKKSNEVVLCGGSYSGFYFTDEEDSVSPLQLIDDELDDEIEEEIDREISKQDDIADSNDNDNEKTNKFDVIQNYSLDDIDKDNCVQDAHRCPNCKNCHYKDYFYGENSNQDTVYKENDKIDDLNIDNEENQDTNIQNIEEENLNKDENNKILNSENVTNDILNSKENNTNIAKLNENEQEDLKDKTQINSTSYKQEQTSICEQTDNKKNNNAEGEQFLSSILEQIEEMFKEYPLDERIMQIIPNSKIVKVEDSIDNSTYIVGAMYDHEQLKYLIYGVPANYNSIPPKELGSNYQWLPLDPDDPLSDGYFLVYQDAQNGKLATIRVE